MGQFPNQCQILWCMTDSNTRIIFAKGDIENPMQRVFNPPMTADDFGGLFRIRGQAGNIVSLSPVPYEEFS